MDAIRIDVQTRSHPYPVLVGEGLASRLSGLLDEHVAARRFVVSNPTVWRFHGRAVSAGARTEPILVPDGERFKNLPTVARIYEALIRAGADRAAAIVTLGGGVVGDMAGFAAATYLRGIGLAHVPTTLLAQVDASVGGKVGVNHPLGKNLIGAFYQPSLVVIDPAVLATLPRREFRSGLYEAIKYGVALSADVFARISRDMTAIFARNPEVLVSLVAECCRLKAAIVAADEREAGPRRVLNYGHTAGHAIEVITKYRRFRHGEAVAYGMLVAADLSVARGLLADDARQALVRLIGQLGPLPPIGDLSAGQIIETMGLDKKVVDGRLHFVLSPGIGTTTIADDVSEEELEAALRRVGFSA